MQRTPPPGPPGHRQTAHPSRMDHQEHARDSLYPTIDDDEPDSPPRHENITPVAPLTEPSLGDLMAAIEALRAETRENQRQIQDLNALFVRTNSPPNRPQSPAATTRRPSPMRETRFDTAPPEGQGHPRRPYEPQGYMYTAPNLLRAGTAPPETRFERETSIAPRERQFSEVPSEIPPYRPPGDARAAAQAPKTFHKPQIFNGTPLENFSSWIWKMESFLRSTRTPADE